MVFLPYLTLGALCLTARADVIDGMSLMQVTTNSTRAGPLDMMSALKKVAEGVSPGFRARLIDAIPKVEADCPKQKYVAGTDCARAVELMTIVTNITDGPEPPKTWETQIRYMLGLHFFLYIPGSLVSFPMLDKDASKGISWNEFLAVFGPDMMKSMDPIFKFMDTSKGETNRDGEISREELHSFLRAAIIIRSVLPEIDAIDPGADTSKCLAMAHRIVVVPQVNGKPLGKYTKLLCIAGIMLGTVLFHCLFCTGSWTSKSPK